MEFDAVGGKDPSIISIADDVYAIAYAGDNDYGFVATVTIATDGQITDPVIDTLEFDAVQGKTPIQLHSSFLVLQVFSLEYS